MAHRPEKMLTPAQEQELEDYLNHATEPHSQASSLSGCASIAGEAWTGSGWSYGARAKQTAKRPL